MTNTKKIKIIVSSVCAIVVIAALASLFVWKSTFDEESYLYALMKQYRYKVWLFILGIVIVAIQIVNFALRLDNSIATYTSIVFSDVLQMLLLSGAMITLKGHQKEKYTIE